MTTSSYMPLYVGDYLADTAHLTTEESGAYLLLIMNYWQRAKPLPADPQRLALIARLSNERWTDVQRTLEQFFTIADGKWMHKRIDAELERYRAKVEKAKEAGKRSAESKKANGRSTDALTFAQQTLQRTFDSSTSTSSSSEEEESKPSLPEQEAAREEVKIPNLDSRGRRGKGEVKASLRKLAEGLAFPVEEMARKAAEAKFPNAYFAELFKNEIRTRFPQAPPEFADRVVAGEQAALQAIYQAILEV